MVVGAPKTGSAEQPRQRQAKRLENASSHIIFIYDSHPKQNISVKNTLVRQN
jgi:hypothetical protein